MATYTQASFGYGTGFCANVSGSGGDYQKSFTKIRFGQNMKVSSVKFKVGKFYGVNQWGSPLDTKGGFVGRFCIWDSNGHIIGSTGEVSGYDVVNNPQINHADVQGTFSPAVTLKANTDYYIGWSCSYAQYFGFVCYYVNNTSSMWNSNAGSFGATDIYWGDVSYGVVYAGGGGRERPAAIIFSLEATLAHTGIKLYANNRWQHHHGNRYNGNSWSEQILYKYNGSSWDQVSTDQTA